MKRKSKSEKPLAPCFGQERAPCQNCFVELSPSWSWCVVSDGVQPTNQPTKLLKFQPMNTEKRIGVGCLRAKRKIHSCEATHATSDWLSTRKGCSLGPISMHVLIRPVGLPCRRRLAGEDKAQPEWGCSVLEVIPKSIHEKYFVNRLTDNATKLYAESCADDQHDSNLPPPDRLRRCAVRVGAVHDGSCQERHQHDIGDAMKPQLPQHVLRVGESVAKSLSIRVHFGLWRHGVRRGVGLRAPMDGLAGGPPCCRILIRFGHGNAKVWVRACRDLNLGP